jgi:hypothetical protein
MTEPLSQADILRNYPDAEFRDRLLDLSALSEFLNHCIIEDAYEVPARLASAVRLTKAGSQLLPRLQSNANPRNECIVSLLLELWWVDLLVDPMNTDVDALASAISDEIRREKIRLPFIYGRTLYDKSFEEFQDGRDVLNHKDTMTLLAGTPQGVFQHGKFVSGPYGLLKSAAYRYVPSRVYFPLYHCEEISCGTFHRTRLTTGVSKISKVDTRARDLLDKRSQIASAWGQVLSEHASTKINPFAWQHAGGLVRFLGDCFTLKELRLIASDLLDNSGGSLRKLLEQTGSVVKSAAEFTSSLTQAQALQAVLLCPDDQIVGVIDSLVLSKRIIIPETEVRFASVASKGGYFHLIPECSNKGVRFSGDAGLSYLRAHHLLTTLFDANDAGSRERLTWLTRGVSGTGFQERLDKYLYMEDLGAAVHALAFDSQRNLDTTKTFVGLSTRAAAHLKGDEALSEAIQWRLGIGSLTNDEQLNLFKEFGKRLTEFVMRTHSYSAADQADIRGAASNFFSKLEGLLRSYLQMATWVMYRDHYASPEGFTYSDGRATAYAVEILSARQSEVTYSSDGKWMLYPLARGFAILADALKELQTSPERYRRPMDQYPRILTQNPSPYTFLFKHRHLFLDLAESSQTAVLGLLREASRKLTSGKVDEIRNLLSHNNPFPEQGDMLTAINAAEAVISEAEEAGLLPIVAELQAETRDSFGRRNITLGTSRGKSVRLVRPSPHFLSGVPGVGAPQFIVRSATYAASSELVRLDASEASEYAELWTNFPRRRTNTPRGQDMGVPSTLGA